MLKISNEENRKTELSACVELNDLAASRKLAFHFAYAFAACASRPFPTEIGFRALRLILARESSYMYHS